jgi:hypothetical protein
MVKDELGLFIKLSRIYKDNEYINLNLPDPSESFFAWAEKNDVLPQWIINLEKKVCKENSYSVEWIEKIKQKSRYQEILNTIVTHDKALPLIRDCLDTIGVNYGIIKGQNYKPFYCGYTRAQRDIDIIVRDLSSGFMVLEQLISMGYEMEKVKFGVGIKNGNHKKLIYYLLVPMHKKMLNGAKVSVDLHAGDFPICGLISINAEIILPRISSSNLGSHDVTYRELESAILVLCAHIAQHWLVSFRDINDLYTLILHSHQLDWKRLIDSLNVLGLGEIFYCLCVLTDNIYRDFNMPKDFFRSHSFIYPHTFNLFQDKKHLLILLERFRFLIRANTRIYGNLRSGLVQSMKDIFFLVINNSPWYTPKNNRPFRLYHSRVVQPLVPHRQLALDYVFRFSHGWDSYLGKIEEISSKKQMTVRFLSYNCILLNENKLDEIFLTPLGVFAQCSYKGQLKPLERKALQKYFEDTFISVPIE